MPWDDQVAAELGAEPDSGSALSRLGTQAFNLPSNIFNAFSSAWYNLGFRDPTQQTEPVALPTIPLEAPKTIPEKLIDFGAGTAAQLPLIMTGEGAVGALGKAAEIPSLLTRILKPAVGFGLAGATESPRDAALSGAVGGAFGAAEGAPFPLRALLAGGIGALSAYQNYEKTQDPTQAAATGVGMSILPFLFGKGAKAAEAADEASTKVPYGATTRAPFTRPPLGPEDQLDFGFNIPRRPPPGGFVRTPDIPVRAETPTGQAEFPMEIRPTPPEGSLIATPATEPPPSAGQLMVPPRLIRIPETVNAPAAPPFRAPIFSPTELRRGLGIRPPEGSLVYPPTFTPQEVARGMARRFTPEALQDVTEQQPPVQTTTPIKDIAQGKENAQPVIINGQIYKSMQEAQDAGAITPPPPQSAEVPSAAATEPPPAINTNRRLTLKSVLHPNDVEMLQKAANRLGVEYKGEWQGMGMIEFKIPESADNAAAGANLTLKSGATYKDLKNAVNAKVKMFEQGDLKTQILKAGTGTAPVAPAKVATLQLAERPVTTAEVQNEMYGPSRWTHVVDVTDASGNAVGKVRGNVTPDGFQVKGANIAAVARGQGKYQQVIRQLADRYGRVTSDTDMQPAAQAAWKKVGARLNQDGSYTLEGSKRPPEPVATLQPEPAVPSSPLETPVEKTLTGEAKEPALAGGQQRGQSVFAQHPDGDWVRADVQGPSPEMKGWTRVKMTDGTEFDVRPEQIREQPKPPTDTDFKEELKAEQEQVVNYGTPEDMAALEEQNQAKEAKRGMKLRRMGEAGFIDAELGRKLGMYVAAPITAGLVSFAVSDPDHRVRNALVAAMGTELMMIHGPKLLQLLTQASPNINRAAAQAKAGAKVAPTTFAGAMWNDLSGLVKAMGANPGMAAAARKLGTQTGLERIAAVLDKYFVRGEDALRLTQQAHENAAILADDMHAAIRALVGMKLPQAQIDAIGDLFRGRISAAQFRRFVNGDQKIINAMDHVLTARTGLQNILIDAIPKNKLQQTVIDSIDNYVTRSYELFHNPDYRPTDAQIYKVADELLPSYRKENPLYTREDVKNIVDTHLAELKQNKNLFSIRKGGYGASIGSLFLEKTPLSPAFQEMLGLYKNPFHEMAATELKLIRLTHNAGVISAFADGVGLDGLKFAMTGPERRAALDNLTAQLKQANVATLQKEIQDKINKLTNYEYVIPAARFGRLSGMFVERKMYQGLATFDGLDILNRSAMTQSMMQLNNWIKQGHTLWSPLQFTRQVMSIPMLGLMGRTGPADWYKAAKDIMEGPGAAEYQRLRSHGIIGTSDFLSGVLKTDVADFLRDREALNLRPSPYRNFKDWWGKYYRMPDLIPRVAAFQREEARLLGMGVGADEAAIRATNFANRYTINYGAAAPGIQFLRQIPFVNQYLTFAFEVARITKNHMQDAILRRDPYSMLVLSTLGTVPWVMQSLSEKMLSPKDQADWDRVKDLSPSYSRSNFKIVTGRLPNGNFHYFDITPLVIHDKWVKMVRDIINGDAKAFWADNPVLGWENTPLLNVARNQMTGEDIHTHEKLDSLSTRLDSVRRDLAPTLMGTDADRFQEALTRNAEGTLGITSAKTGRETSLGSILGSYLTAVRGYSINPNYLVKQAIYDAQTSMDSERQMMNRVLTTNAAADVKQAAIDRFKNAALQIQMNLRSKLGVNQGDYLQTAP